MGRNAAPKVGKMRRQTSKHPELVAATEVVDDWIAELMRRLQWRDRDLSYRALVSCLHGLRDALSKDPAIFLGLALPLLIRGLYFEGWRPSGRAASSRTRKGFLGRIHEGVGRDPGVDPEQVAHAVLALLSDWLPKSEVENARAASPAALHAFWS